MYLAGIVCTGDAKADVLRNIVREGSSGKYPAGMVMPSAGLDALVWCVDTSQLASCKLQPRHTARSCDCVVNARNKLPETPPQVYGAGLDALVWFVDKPAASKL